MGHGFFVASPWLPRIKTASLLPIHPFQFCQEHLQHALSACKEAQVNLQVRMEEFLLEEVDAQRLGLGQVVELYLDLIGDPRPEVLGQVGLIQFLQAHGVTDPQVTDLSASWVARFYEYHIQYWGDPLGPIYAQPAPLLGHGCPSGSWSSGRTPRI